MPGSSSSTEVIAGYRVIRRLGASVWEAVQPGLERRVALRRLPPGTTFRPAVWPDRPGVVDLFAVVEDPGGTYVATGFVPGARTLAELAGARASRRRRWLDQAGDILEGTVHGDLTAADILIDPSGRVLVTGFGRGAPDATAHDDRAAIARLRPPPRALGRTALVAAGLLGVAAAAIGLGVASVVRDDDERPPAPAVPPGAVALGSALAPGPMRSVDCEDRRPGGDSLACTILQGRLDGRPLATTGRVRVRSWVVEGARGRMRLQVLRSDGARFRQYVSGPAVAVPDTAPYVVTEDLVVPAGMRFALEVAPGSAIGVRDDVAGARTLRFYGPLRGDLRIPDGGRGAEQELLLRVDVVPVG